MAPAGSTAEPGAAPQPGRAKHRAHRPGSQSWGNAVWAESAGIPEPSSQLALPAPSAEAQMSCPGMATANPAGAEPGQGWSLAQGRLR